MQQENRYRWFENILFLFFFRFCCAWALPFASVPKILAIFGYNAEALQYTDPNIELSRKYL